MDEVVVTAGETVADMNEAFAVQVIAGTLAHRLALRGSGTGVATVRIGVGQGAVLVLER
ncbi:hypothetical protein ACWGJB_28375 [Streptomyces sp. NPDC054813]